MPKPTIAPIGRSLRSRSPNQRYDRLLLAACALLAASASAAPPPYYIGEILPTPKRATYRDAFAPIYDVAARRPLATIVAGQGRSAQLAAQDFIARVCELAGLDEASFKPQAGGAMPQGLHHRLLARPQPAQRHSPALRCPFALRNASERRHLAPRQRRTGKRIPDRAGARCLQIDAGLAALGHGHRHEAGGVREVEAQSAGTTRATQGGLSPAAITEAQAPGRLRQDLPKQGAQQPARGDEAPPVGLEPEGHGPRPFIC